MDENEAKRDALLDNYAKAHELYIHEDNLCWTKINHLVILNSGFFAAWGFLVLSVDNTQRHLRALAVGLCAFAFLINALLGAMLICGAYYLSKRKERCIYYESKIIKNAKDRIHTGRVKSNSLTLRIMYLTPALLCIVWIGILLLSINL